MTPDPRPWSERAADPDPAARRGVAEDPAAPAATLAHLAADADAAVRRAVARNPSTPAAALARLAADPDVEVREGVARNVAAPADVLARLVRDPDARVSLAVVERAPLPPPFSVASADPPLRAAPAADAPVRWPRPPFGRPAAPASESVPPPPAGAAPAPAVPSTPAARIRRPPESAAVPAILVGAPAPVRDAYRGDGRGEHGAPEVMGAAPRRPFTTYRVWFATNRRPVGGPGSRTGGHEFGGESAEVTSYGRCDVDIPHDRPLGSLGSPAWKRLLRRADDRLCVGAIQPLAENAYWSALADVLADLPPARARATVFLHGYNVGFTEAALRAAQLGHDLRVPGPMCFFSWPSKGGLFGYAADAAAIEASEPAITRYLTRLAADTGAERVDVIAHSMGNRGLLRALDRITANAEAAARCRFGHFVLAAPDVDRRTFLNLAAAYRCGRARTTLYISGRDRALGVSAWLHAFGRAGFAPPVTVAEGVDTVHVENADRSLLAHGYFGSVRTVLTDMHDVLEFDAPPERRAGLRAATTPDGRPFWRIAP